MPITTSRTRPKDSPSGPSTIIRASRATYTLLTDAMLESVGSRVRDGSSAGSAPVATACYREGTAKIPTTK